MKTELRTLTISALVIYLTTISCAKVDYTIGREAPQVEIQKCVKLSEKKRFEEAIECLEIFKSRFSQTAYGTEAELYIADNYFRNKEYLLAADTYLTFAKMHPTSSKIDYAYYQLGLSYLEESPKAIDRDQQYLDDAIRYLGIVVGGFPGSPYHEVASEKLKEARSRVAMRHFYIGKFYFKNAEYIAAIPRFQEILDNYPETDLIPETLYRLTIANARLKRIDEAKLYFTKLATEHPNNEWTTKAEPKLLRYAKKYGGD